MSTVMLDRERTIRLDMTALGDFEEATGRSLLEGFDFAVIAPRDLSALLWAGLGGPDSGLTVRDVGRLVTIANLATVTEALLTAWKEFAGMPKEPANGGAEPDPNAERPE